MNDDPQTFSCRYCGVNERYDQEPFYLLAWWQAADAFDTKHFACRNATPQATSAADADAAESVPQLGDSK